MRTLTLMTALLLAAPITALAQDGGDGEAPAEEATSNRGLLEKVGVRVPVPEDGWEMNIGEFDLSARSERGLAIIGWTTPFQQQIEESDLEAWQKAYTDKADTEGFIEPELVESAMTEVQGRPAVSYTFNLQTAEEDPVVMHAVGFEAIGGNFHVGTIGGERSADDAKELLEQILGELEFRGDLPELEFGGEIAIPNLGAKEGQPDSFLPATLDPYYRPLVKNEFGPATRALSAVGVASLRGCWTAVHPVPADAGDLLVACKDPDYSYFIVDEFTIGDIASELQGSWPWVLPTATPSTETYGSHLGVWWDSKVQMKKVGVAAVPVPESVAQVIVYGGNDHDKAVAAAKSTLQNQAFRDLPPAPLDELVRYYVTYRPTSPLVIGPAIGAAVLLLLIFGIIIFGLRREAMKAREEMESIDAY